MVDPDSEVLTATAVASKSVPDLHSDCFGLGSVTGMRVEAGTGWLCDKKRLVLDLHLRIILVHRFGLVLDVRLGIVLVLRLGIGLECQLRLDYRL